MFKKLTVTAVSLTVFCFGADQPTADPKFSLEWRVFTYSFNKPEIVPSADSVPLSLRQVPIHKGDGGDGIRSLTIPDSHVDLHNLHHIGTGFGFRVAPLKRLAIRAGAYYSATVNSGPRMDSSGNTREVNFGGTTQRGVGESLVYYSIGFSPTKFPSPYGEIEAKIGSNLYLSFGGSYTQYGISLDRGWDRYNELENWRNDKLGDIKIREPYVGIGFGDEFGRVVFRAGPTFNSSSILPIAQGIKMPSQNGFAIGMDTYWDFANFPRHRTKK